MGPQGPTPQYPRRRSPALDVNGQIHFSGELVFPDGSLQGSSGWPSGTCGSPGPGSTSAVCFTVAPSLLTHVVAALGFSNAASRGAASKAGRRSQAVRQITYSLTYPLRPLCSSRREWAQKKALPIRSGSAVKSVPVPNRLLPLPPSATAAQPPGAAGRDISLWIGDKPVTGASRNR